MQWNTNTTNKLPFFKYSYTPYKVITWFQGFWINFWTQHTCTYPNLMSYVKFCCLNSHFCYWEKSISYASTIMQYFKLGRWLGSQMILLFLLIVMTKTSICFVNNLVMCPSWTSSGDHLWKCAWNLSIQQVIVALATITRQHHASDTWVMLKQQWVWITCPQNIQYLRTIHMGK